jgi:hyperosmotically inducible periplasmic protein
MVKRLFLVICGVAMMGVMANQAAAQAAAQTKEKTVAAGTQAKEKTKSAVKKTGEVLTDAEITTAVKTKLLADKTVGGKKIDVDTDKGIVTLTGPVKSATERRQAVRLAHETKGVKKVVNKLTIEK